MRTASGLAVIVGLMALGPVLAEAATTGLANKVFSTTFSGEGGGPNRTLGMPPDEGAAIYGILATEDSDDPCYFEAQFQDVRTGAVRAEKIFAECTPPDSEPSGALRASRRTLLLGEGSFVTGVRVCLNNDRDKIKGVQLFGGYGGCILGATSVTVQPTGCSQVFSQSGHEQRVCNTDPPNYVTYQCSSGSVSPTPFFERTNCVGDNDGPDADWESPMHCPNGMVAVGMRLSTRPGGKERRMIDGIALDCSPLQGTP
jgi:hypothetical protein